MRTIDVEGRKSIGCGSFFVVYRLTRRRVLKVPQLDYMTYPTEEFEGVLKAADMTAEAWLVADAIRGSRLPGALPVLEIVNIAGTEKLGLVYPYAKPAVFKEFEEFDAFPNKTSRMWVWDHSKGNYGRYRGELVRIDTQTRAVQGRFRWDS